MRQGLWIALLWMGCGSDMGLVYTEKSNGGEDDTAIEAVSEGDFELDEDSNNEEPYEDSNNEEPPEDGVEEEPPEDYEEDTIDESEEVDDEVIPEAPVDDCTETSDLIYAVDKENSQRLYTFDPQSNSFEVVGSLDCTMFGSPSSMSVSRDGFAYVRYNDHSIYQVALSDLSCTESSYSNGSFGAFGMGYSTNSSLTWEDTMFVANGSELVSLDTQTWERNEIGSMPSHSELTGNANGELWAFLPLEEPATLARLNKNNANVEESIFLDNFPDPGNIDTFAFAYWGGDFYLFVREYGMGNSTNVYKVDSSGVMTTVLEDSGLDIVGAGVSTCAPTE